MFELLSMDVTMRDQWINAINFLVEYRNKYKVDVRTLSSSKNVSNDTEPNKITPVEPNEIQIA